MDKPKRQLTEEQLAKLAVARAKANEVRRKNYEINNLKKKILNMKRIRKKYKKKKNEKRLIML